MIFVDMLMSLMVMMFGILSSAEMALKADIAFMKTIHSVQDLVWIDSSTVNHCAALTVPVRDLDSVETRATEVRIPEGEIS